MRQGSLQVLDAGVQIFDSLPVDESELIHIVKVKAGVSEDALSHVVELMLMMEVFDGLLEAYGDEEADDDGGDVDEEVLPRGSGGARDVRQAWERAPSSSLERMSSPAYRRSQTPPPPSPPLHP